MMVLDHLWSRSRSRSRSRPRADTWGGGRLLPGAFRPLGIYKPVLALTILRSAATTPEIVVGVRDPESNRYHQNVASVPTRRIHPAIAHRWIWALRLRRHTAVSRRSDLHDEVATLFSRKLGLADRQERGEIRFRIQSLAASQGISVIGETSDGQPRVEKLTMFNAVVWLEKGDEHLPQETASYRPLVWADANNFIEMSETRDTGRLGLGFERFFFCAYGLCLQTSVLALKRLRQT
ncbi:hypothetical protein SAMN05421812_10780 [Asanoa hainanensis]|uniref:Uncharacterized protein n=1 Tax=Asanoa hainanensis TaxID=560556 RepID=A0A239N291_9ACTN|nr:hypothetical protein [Asanoa hainanensis]SNT48279.1 hypothetical protein SAMN05421812_10780 [Asanoa hainanensis]